MMSPQEQWKNVIFPVDTITHLEEKFGIDFVLSVQQKYYLSATGLIRRIEYYQPMPKNGTKFIPEKVWDGNPDKDGYRIVSLTGSGKEYTMRLHRLLGFTFLSWCDGCNQIDHKNGIKYDNRVDNLEWVTGSENTKRKFKLQLDSTKGSCNGNAKLTEPQVINIKRVLTNGGKRSVLATCYDVAIQTIDSVANGSSWTHVDDISWNRSLMNTNRSKFASI